MYSRVVSCKQMRVELPYHTKRRIASLAQDRANPFWSHTTGRWLWNDTINRARRYTPFDIEGLKNLACRVCSANRCTGMVQLGHGFKTKIFHLQFDNGQELVARIPTLLRGNLRLSVGSEAATTEYVRLRYNEGKEDSWAIPKIPRVLAWNSTCRNPVKWPYILTEYISGVDLQSIWSSPSCKIMERTIIDVVEFEETLLSQDTFSQYGSLYFTEDVDKYNRDDPLYAEPPKDPLRIALSHKFRVGPTAHPDWWRGGNCHVPAARGPWYDLRNALVGTAEFQLRALEPDYNPLFSTSARDDIDYLTTPLRTSVTIAHDLVPEDGAFLRSVLQHPNLSRGNIILPHDSASGSGPNVKGIIDWEGAVVGPLFVQVHEAPAFAKDGPTKMTGDWSDPPLESEKEILAIRDPKKREQLRMHVRVAERDSYYFITSLARSKVRCDAILWKHELLEIAKLYRYLPRTIVEGPGGLRCILFSLKKEWDKFASTPCPIEMSDEEEEKSEAEAKTLEARQSQMQDILVGIGCSSDGWVENERYDEAKKALECFQRYWDRGKTAEELGPFPFHDSGYSPLLA